MRDLSAGGLRSRDCCIRKDVLWDLMAIYPPGAEWSDRMPVAVFFNGTVVDVVDGLEKALRGG